MREQQKKRTPSKNAAAAEARRQQIASGLVQQKSVPQIAAELGVSRQAVHAQVQQPETQALIRSLMAPHRERLGRVVDQAIGTVERALVSDHEQRLERIAWLRDRIDRLRLVIAERAAAGAKQHAGIPGMGTGLLVHGKRAVGMQVIDEYEVDTGLLSELRQHEEQLRRELNDFTLNLKAVERARDLLELAEGRRDDGDSAGAPGARFAGTLEEVLVAYRRIVAPARNQTTRRT